MDRPLLSPRRQRAFPASLPLVLIVLLLPGTFSRDADTSVVSLAQSTHGSDVSATNITAKAGSGKLKESVGRSSREGRNASKGRAPSCGGCERRESALSQTMRLHSYSRTLRTIGPIKSLIFGLCLLVVICICIRKFMSQELIITLMYTLLYFIASPTAILVNKILMKDLGFGYPVLVSALGQGTTALMATVAVRLFDVPIENGRQVGTSNMIVLGGASALALVLGQYPYLYLTVAFIQMLKAFSPAYLVVFLSCLGVEYPSRRVVFCVLGLSLCTAIASAGEVNFNVIGVIFMAGASCSDALRLVIAQKLLTNHKMHPIETLYYTSPVCLLWMVPAALILEVPKLHSNKSLLLVTQHPLMFLASACSGCFVNISTFLLVKRTSSMTLKTMTMTRNGGLVIVSALLMGETITTLEAIGYSGLLFCFGLYTYVKARERDAPKQTNARGNSRDEPTTLIPLIHDSKCHSSPEPPKFDDVQVVAIDPQSKQCYSPSSNGKSVTSSENGSA